MNTAESLANALSGKLAEYERSDLYRLDLSQPELDDKEQADLLIASFKTLAARAIKIHHVDWERCDFGMMNKRRLNELKSELKRTQIESLEKILSDKLSEVKQSGTLDLKLLDLADEEYAKVLLRFFKELESQGIKIQHLNLSKCQIGTMELTSRNKLMEALKPVLSDDATLDLSGNHLGAMGSMRVVRWFKTLPPVKTLHLRENQFDVLDAPRLNEAMAGIPASVKVLDLSANNLENTRLAIEDNASERSQIRLIKQQSALEAAPAETVPAADQTKSQQAANFLTTMKFDKHFKSISDKIEKSDKYFTDEDTAKKLLAQLHAAKEKFLCPSNDYDIAAFRQECITVIGELHKNLAWRALLGDLLAQFLEATHLNHGKEQGRALFGIFPPTGLDGFKTAVIKTDENEDITPFPPPA